jgi:hypothetical protein
MADQLLSQADVDALIASLSKNDPPKPAAPAPVAAPKPAPAAKPAAVAPAAPKAAASATVPVNAPKPAPAATANRPAAPIPVSSPVRNDASAGDINSLNAKISDLTRQVNSMSTAMKRLELMEKKMAEMEAKNAKSNPALTDQKIQQLTDELKKIIGNLKGTPGYGVKDNFTCEKCEDHGHVAVQFRCTSCGHERWYGWWPEKKK